MEHVLCKNLNHICQNTADCVDSAAYDSFIAYCYHEILQQEKSHYLFTNNNYEKICSIIAEKSWQCPNKLRTAIYLCAMFATAEKTSLQVLQTIAKNACGDCSYDHLVLDSDRQMVQVSSIQAICWFVRNGIAGNIMYV